MTTTGSTAHPARDGSPSGGGITIVICLIVAMLEGFDIQAAGVAAPRLAPALGLAPDQLGLFFSASTLGMLLGAYVGGWAADRWGRKPVLILAVLTFAIGSLATGAAQALPGLALSRLITGLGLGSGLPALIALVAERNPGRSNRAVAMMYAGTPLGGAFVGVASSALTNWRHIFYAGGLLPVLVVPVLVFLLKESHTRKAPGADKPGIGQLWREGRAATTALLWIAFFTGMMVLYLMLNWTPMLLAARTFSGQQIALFQAVFNIAGGLAVLAAATPLDGPWFRTIAIGAYALTIGALVALAQIPAQTAAAMLVALLFGAGLLVSQSILYATASRLYPPQTRGTGVGAAVAVGRLGSVAGPLLGGIALHAGLTPRWLILLTIPVIILAALAIVAAINRHRAVQKP